MKLMRVCTTGLIVSLLSCSLSIVSFASEDREKIGSIKLDVSASFDRGDEVDESSFSVDTSTEGVEVSGIELNYESSTREDETWSKYDTPILYVYLTADEDYYFDKCSKGTFSFEGDEAEYVDAKRDSDKSEITLTIRILPLNDNVGNVFNLYWDDTSIGHWTKGYKNTKYDLKLYYNGSPYKSYETTNLSYDFANDMKRAGEYYFSVRGKAAKKYSSDYVKSDVITITDIQANELAQKVVNNTKTHTTTNKGPNTTVKSTLTAGWQSTPTGWWYRHSDGGYTRSNWEFINNKWYYFDTNGYMMTGWQFINNKWYLLASSGDMLTGWQFINNKWYYLNASGDMKTGWFESNGLWYYLSDFTGEMLVNTNTPDGRYVNADGVWVQ